MSKKVFISYSHKDESFKNDLDDHLSTLRRNKFISVWHDRKILAGTEWKGEIDKNLKDADIVIFLISPSFLASEYCNDIEVNQAMTNNHSNKCQIISIIIRPCDWKECEFSKFQVLPKDSKPISKWDDKDEAWLDSINSIKSYIKEFKPIVKPSYIENKKDKLSVSAFTSNWLSDTEIVLSHRNTKKVNLEDVFVVPDVDPQSFDDDNFNVISSDKIFDENKNVLITGEEQQGKTSLLKYFYNKCLKRSELPIYVDCCSVNKSDLNRIIELSLEKQYENIELENYLDMSNIVLLLDNIDGLKLNEKHRSILIRKINETFDKVVVTCHTAFSYVHDEVNELNGFEKVEILGFGHKKREELSRKWLSLGQEESISDQELYEQCDEVKARLNIIIKRNIVPSKPIYILMLLQMFEANDQLKTELTSYGHCYQQLIYQTFEKAKIKTTDFDKYLNVLSEFSWWILVNEKNPNDFELNEFFVDYCNKYLPVNKYEVLSKLIQHSILQEKNYRTGFKYPYIYYFFAGKKIAESYRDSEEVVKKVDNLLLMLHREDYANILIFITHHTKDSWVLNEINNVLSTLFKVNKSASLNKDQLFFMEDFMRQIPDLVIEQREIQKERDNHNENLDKMEREIDNINNDAYEAAADSFANINKTFKGMEIAGQIIRNRHASLTTDSMINLAASGVNSGLRFLEYFIKISGISKQRVIKLILNNLSDNPSSSDREIEKDAEAAYMHLTYGVINGILRKIAASVGSKEALSIYEKVEEKTGTPAVMLIRLSIDLQFNKNLNIKNVIECSEKLKDNVVCTRILKEMVIQHTYMFPVDYKIKQKLSSALDISLKAQKLMDQRSAGKG